jgi:hypothetical protein
MSRELLQFYMFSRSHGNFLVQKIEKKERGNEKNALSLTTTTKVVG